MAIKRGTKNTLKVITDDLTDAFAGVDSLPGQVLAEERLTDLHEACCTAFEDEIHPGIIENIMQYCDFVNQRMIGRAAGKLEDLIVRYLFRYYASGIDIRKWTGVCHMEIGVLFGAATIYAEHATWIAGKSIPIVVIEPFQGYYDKGLDPLTDLEVSEENFSRNLDLFEIPRESIEIVKGLSTDPAIIQRCRSKKVLSILIDGDHSYESVLSDWANFSPLVVPGGYVLFDDYKSPSWPEVTRCIDREILPRLNAQWRVLLDFGSSLLVQRTG